MDFRVDCNLLVDSSKGYILHDCRAQIGLAQDPNYNHGKCQFWHVSPQVAQMMTCASPQVLSYWSGYLRVTRSTSGSSLRPGTRGTRVSWQQTTKPHILLDRRLQNFDWLTLIPHFCSSFI